MRSSRDKPALGSNLLGGHEKRKERPLKTALCLSAAVSPERKREKKKAIGGDGTLRHNSFRGRGKPKRIPFEASERKKNSRRKGNDWEMNSSH